MSYIACHKSIILTAHLVMISTQLSPPPTIMTIKTTAKTLLEGLLTYHVNMWETPSVLIAMQQNLLKEE